MSFNSITAAQLKTIQIGTGFEACFICGYETKPAQLLRCHTKKYENYPEVPYYNILAELDPAPNALPVNKVTNSVNACSLCVKILYHQWLDYEKKKLPDRKRLYWMKRPPGCEIKVLHNQVELEEILYDGEEVIAGSLASKTSPVQDNTLSNSLTQQLIGQKRKLNFSNGSLADNSTKTLKIDSDDEGIQNGNSLLTSLQQTAANISSSVGAASISTASLVQTAATGTGTAANISQPATQPTTTLLSTQNLLAAYANSKISTTLKTSAFCTEVHCYLCGLKSHKNGLTRILARRLNENDDPNTPYCEKILTMKCHNKGVIYGDYSTFLCSICYRQLHDEVEKEKLLLKSQLTVQQSQMAGNDSNAETLKFVQQLAQMINDAGKSKENEVEELSEKQPTAQPEKDEKPRILSPINSSASLENLPETPEIGVKIEALIQQSVAKPAEISIISEAQNCTICEKLNSTKLLHTQPRNKSILETCFSSKLDFDTFSFFPILSSLNSDAAHQNSSTVTVCNICYHNLKIQWEHHEDHMISQKEIKEKNNKQGSNSQSKVNKKERWLRTYFVNECKCCSCGEECEISDLVEIRLKNKIPKMFLRGLFYVEKNEFYVVCCQSCVSLNENKEDLNQYLL